MYSMYSLIALVLCGWDSSITFWTCTWCIFSDNFVILFCKGCSYSISTCSHGMENKNNGPLTAVPSVSLTFIPNCPCFYRWSVWVWCHAMTSSREKVMCKIALLLIGHFSFPKWVTWPLFVLADSDWSKLVTWPKQIAMQFSTWLSSSGGIVYLKKRIFFYKIVW